MAEKYKTSSSKILIYYFVFDIKYNKITAYLSNKTIYLIIDYNKIFKVLHLFPVIINYFPPLLSFFLQITMQLPYVSLHFRDV